LSVNGQTVVPVAVSSVQQSQQHTVAQASVMYTKPSVAFNPAAFAYKFTVTPSTA